MTDLVKVTDKGHVRTIRLNRPEKKNALNNELATGAWSRRSTRRPRSTMSGLWPSPAAATPSAPAWTCPAPERVSPFTAQTAQLDGHQLGRPFPAVDPQALRPSRWWAGINGVGWSARGSGLAMATDVRIVAKSARLMAGYTRIGGSPDAGLTITLPQAMGYERAMRFMMENRTANGDDAVAWGMAGEVVEDADFDARLEAYCQQLCDWSPITLRLLKRGMVKSMESTDMEQQLRYEVSNIRIAFSSEDAKEARTAFFEKRKPVFSAALSAASTLNSAFPRPPLARNEIKLEGGRPISMAEITRGSRL